MTQVLVWFSIYMSVLLWPRPICHHIFVWFRFELHDPKNSSSIKLHCSVVIEVGSVITSTWLALLPAVSNAASRLVLILMKKLWMGKSFLTVFWIDKVYRGNLPRHVHCVGHWSPVFWCNVLQALSLWLIYSGNHCHQWWYYLNLLVATKLQKMLVKDN